MGLFKVVLVDDEPWALVGIHDAFPWKESGFEVIAQTTRSVEALEIILREDPDVVFTDIRMPKISGIELMKQVRDLGRDTEFIVVSGFSEFTYAQQSLQQGAFDYCLKPLQTEVTAPLLEKLYKHLTKKYKSKSTDLFGTLVESKGDILEELKKLGIKCRFQYYQAVVIIDPGNGSRLEGKDYFEGIDHLKITLGKNKVFYFLNSDCDQGALFYPDERSGLSYGISRLSESPSAFEELCSEADMAASAYFIYGVHEKFAYKERNIAFVNTLLEEIVSAVERNSVEDLKKMIGSIPESFINNGLAIHDLEYLWNYLVAFVYKKLVPDITDTSLEFMDYRQIMYQNSDIKAFCENLFHEMIYLLKKTGAGDNGENGETENAQFNEMVRYIQEHYSEPLMLKELSKKFFINPNYCCRLFKKHMDSTFSGYLNRIRLEKSRELLRNARFTVDEIAQKVGYSDYFYFNKVFKKFYGITPSKYRKEAFGE